MTPEAARLLAGMHSREFVDSAYPVLSFEEREEERETERCPTDHA